MPDRIDLVFPGDTPMVFVHGQHWQQGHEILGRFDREQLEFCLLAAEVWTEDREIVQGRMYG